MLQCVSCILPPAPLHQSNFPNDPGRKLVCWSPTGEAGEHRQWSAVWMGLNVLRCRADILLSETRVERQNKGSFHHRSLAPSVSRLRVTEDLAGLKQLACVPRAYISTCLNFNWQPIVDEAFGSQDQEKTDWVGPGSSFRTDLHGGTCCSVSQISCPSTSWCLVYSNMYDDATIVDRDIFSSKLHTKG